MYNKYKNSEKKSKQNHSHYNYSFLNIELLQPMHWSGNPTIWQKRGPCYISKTVHSPRCPPRVFDNVVVWGIPYNKNYIINFFTWTTTKNSRRVRHPSFRANCHSNYLILNKINKISFSNVIIWVPSSFCTNSLCFTNTIPIVVLISGRILRFCWNLLKS